MTLEPTEEVEKAFGLPEGIDPSHRYVYRSGEHGVYDFWYQDNYGNYWQYTNAPKDSPDYDPLFGEAMLVPDQPMPHETPQFYSDTGRKLNAAIPPGLPVTYNEAYDPLNPRSIWYAMYRAESGDVRYVYFDQDVRENLDLWVQYMLRVTDAGILPYRRYAAKLFKSPHPKDVVIGAMLILMDQGIYEAWELVNATVGDVEFIDNAVKFLGRKIVCDEAILAFFVQATTNRDSSEPLFMLKTAHGINKVGPRHFYSILRGLKMSSHFMLSWRATQIFSKIVHRCALELLPRDELEEKALSELSRALNLGEDPLFLVDAKTREALMDAYTDMLSQAQQQAEGLDFTTKSEDINKALVRVTSDDLGVAMIWSDLTEKTPAEAEFSQWLHSSPMHDTTPAISQMDEAVLDAETAAETQENEPAQQSAQGDSAGSAQGLASPPEEGGV